MSEHVHLAVDLGASSGRVLAGRFDGDLLRLEEMHRFANGPVRIADSLFWDLPALWQHVLDGMRQAAEQFPSRIASIGVATWGVDFGLLGRGDVLLGNPYHYRDTRTDGILERACDAIGRNEIFAQTGLQFMPFNTLFQLLAMQWGGSPLLAAAERLLLMPDLFHWLLSGVKVIERTNASTTQFYNPQSNDWAFELLKRFELPAHLLSPLVDPGTRLGQLRSSVAEATGLQGVEVIAPATHDTASAVLAVPVAPTDQNWCYISSGTWSLLGAELSRPVLTDRCRELNFTNEVGVGGTIRLLKNIGGLWLLQESRRAWGSTGKNLNWDELVRLAQQAEPLVSFVDPDHVSLLAPTDMPAAIRAYCSMTGQRVPADEGSLVRCILESLALKYRNVLESLEQVCDRRFDTIHIIGGGTQNRDLCQFTASACGRTVLAGPVEATAAGNILVQAIATGALGTIADARDVVRRSFEIVEYRPHDRDAWQSAYERFLGVVNRQGSTGR